VFASAVRALCCALFVRALVIHVCSILCCARQGRLCPSSSSVSNSSSISGWIFVLLVLVCLALFPVFVRDCGRYSHLAVSSRSSSNSSSGFVIFSPPFASTSASWSISCCHLSYAESHVLSGLPSADVGWSVLLPSSVLYRAPLHRVGPLSSIHPQHLHFYLFLGVHSGASWSRIGGGWFDCRCSIGYQPSSLAPARMSQVPCVE
jgi:hypothetical protein